MEQFVPIGKVFESPLNPRKHFNEKKMEELIESIRAKGILMPLLVRPNNSRFEIAAGHRRYRAAIKVKLTEVPVIVREMNETDFLEVITIENLQREDIEPLDEAQGYRTLMEKTNYDVPAIAAKVGKSESYIYQRIKLLELVPEAQELLINGKITAGHAILIARLQPDQQKELVKKESDLYEGWGPDRTVVSVRDLANHIERQIHLDLNAASFKKNDPNLVLEAGPCTTCPKRTGFAPALFPEIKKKDTCTDPSCFHKKVEVFSAQWLEKRSQASDVPPLRLSTDSNYRMKKISEDMGQSIPSNFYREITDKKKESCEYSREGIVVEGHRPGRIMNVCIDPTCPKHHAKLSYADDGGYKARQKAEEEKRKLAFKIREAILDATLKAWPGKLFTKEDLLLLTKEFYKPIWTEFQKKILARRGLKPKKRQYNQDYQVPMNEWLAKQSSSELLKFLLEIALFRDIERHSTDKRQDDLIETAKRYGVDPKKIEAEFRAEVKTKKAEKIGKKKKSPSVKQKCKPADPPKAKTIPIKDLCKLREPAKPKGVQGKEIRVPADQTFLAMVEKSYSGDLLVHGGSKIREPFQWGGDSYVSLGGMSSGAEGFIEEEAWRVVPANLFQGKTYGYDEIIARWDHNEKERGSHDGQRVLLRNEKYVLQGPRVIFYVQKTGKKTDEPKSGVCRECGCTHETPCIDPVNKKPCAWADRTKTLCTFCRTKGVEEVIEELEKEEIGKEHQWEKQNIVTVASTRKVPMHDIYKCKKCEAMGKRFGVGPVKPDKPFTELKCTGLKAEECNLEKSKDGICSHLWRSADNGETISSCPPRKCCRGCKKLENCNSHCASAEKVQPSAKGR